MDAENQEIIDRIGHEAYNLIRAEAVSEAADALNKLPSSESLKTVLQFSVEDLKDYAAKIKRGEA